MKTVKVLPRTASEYLLIQIGVEDARSLRRVLRLTSNAAFKEMGVSSEDIDTDVIYRLFHSLEDYR